MTLGLPLGLALAALAWALVAQTGDPDRAGALAAAGFPASR
jgi:hypothetical protein